MIQNPEHLAAFVRDTLRYKESCRIFEHVLRHCWEVPPAEQAVEIAAFAVQHGWQVKIHEPAKIGIVADFTN